jgi:S-adenosylmethionine hydrolase
MARPIVFLTDYGLADGFVGICHGVMARRRLGGVHGLVVNHGSAAATLGLAENAAVVLE